MDASFQVQNILLLHNERLEAIESAGHSRPLMEQQFTEHPNGLISALDPGAALQAHSAQLAAQHHDVAQDHTGEIY
jgi:hypothetical protein